MGVILLSEIKLNAKYWLQLVCVKGEVILMVTARMRMKCDVQKKKKAN